MIHERERRMIAKMSRENAIIDIRHLLDTAERIIKPGPRKNELIQSVEKLMRTKRINVSDLDLTMERFAAVAGHHFSPAAKTRLEKPKGINL